MSMICYMDTPIGVLQIECREDVLYSVKVVSDFDGMKSFKDNFIVKQLNEYFAGERKTFNVNKRLLGTPFQLKVWQALEEIPYGETLTYKQIAEKIGQPKSVRAVGGAIHKNPIAIIVPCHRVIGSNGEMIGYAYGVEKKSWLLYMESSLK